MQEASGISVCYFLEYASPVQRSKVYISFDIIEQHKFIRREYPASGYHPNNHDIQIDPFFIMRQITAV